MVAAIACGDDDGGGDATPAASATISAEEAERTLRDVALSPEDVGEAYALESERVQTNEQAAAARPDQERALEQYAAWGQVLAYNAQYAAPPSPELVFSGRTARIMHTVTLFEDAEGPAASFVYLQGLDEELIANVLTNEGAGTQLVDIQVAKDLAFPAKGDGSFAWRFSGKATFEDGLTVNFVADSVFVRSGRLAANVTTVALGGAPPRPELEALVDRWLERAAAAR